MSCTARARAALLLAVSSGGGVALASLPAEAQQRAPDWHVARVVLDSVVVRVEHWETEAWITAETPSGAFRVRTDSPTLAAWATAVSQLEPPTRGDGAGRVDIHSMTLRESSGSGVMRLARLTADSLPILQLDAANDAFSHAAHLSPQQWRALRDALAREWRDTTLRECSEALPCHEFKADVPARRADGNPRPYPPGVMRLSVGNARVVVEFVVGVDGRPRPETILIVQSPHPLLSKEVRDTLLKWRFEPARKNGVPVPVRTVERFEFRVR